MDQDSGTEREVDILIEQKVAGAHIRIAIECRDRSRRETIEWIDSFAGKYRNNEVNKKIAVSSSGFSDAARHKALANNIDLLTVEEAAKVDWAARIAAEFFTIMTHNNMLLCVGAFSADGVEVASSNIDPDNPQIIPGNITHKDTVSEKLFPLLYSYFVQYVREKADQAIIGLIGKDWQRFFTDPTPRYCEMQVNKVGAEINLDGNIIRIDRLVFGCGTKFQFTRADVDNRVLGDVAMLSRFTLGKIAEREFRVNMVTDRERGIVSVEVSPTEQPAAALEVVPVVNHIAGGPTLDGKGIVMVWTLDSSETVTFAIPIIDLPSVIAYMFNQAKRASERCSEEELSPRARSHQDVPIQLTSIALGPGGDNEHEQLYMRAGRLESVYQIPRQILVSLAKEIIRLFEKPVRHRSFQTSKKARGSSKRG